MQGDARHGIVKGAGIQVCGCLPHQVSRQILLRFRRRAALQQGSYVKQGFGSKHVVQGVVVCVTSLSGCRAAFCVEQFFQTHCVLLLPLCFQHLRHWQKLSQIHAEV